MILNRQRTVRIPRQALESFLRRIRRHLRLGRTEVNVAFVTDAAIARMNQTYRKKRGPTDVLSFPASADPSPYDPSLRLRKIGHVERDRRDRSASAFCSARPLRAGSRSGGIQARSRRIQAVESTEADREQIAGSLATGHLIATSFLGDIAISPVTARRNAKKFGRTLPDELRILMLHGILHLLGYDHEADSGQMDRLEQNLRQRLGLA